MNWLSSAIEASRKGVSTMSDCDYLVEALTPKRTDGALDKTAVNQFAERYYRVVDHGMGLSVPDNPMGQPRHSLLEMIEKAGLPVILPKLDPQSIGGTKSVVTSTDLIRYINREYAGIFTTGAAFNQYNAMPLENERLKLKIEAGAKFVITQPVMGKDAHVDALFNFNIPVVVEAWMSKKVDLFLRSIRSSDPNLGKDFDPLNNLRILHNAYPQSCIYLSMLGFKQSWKAVLPRL
jgi:methylenetetrahydrofolate reductase (NADPH)